MAAVTVFVASGGTSSTQFTLDGTAGTGLTVFVGSWAALGWHLAFATSSGGPYARLKRDDGSGQDTVVLSGASGGVFCTLEKPSIFGRLESSAATANSGANCTVIEARR